MAKYRKKPIVIEAEVYKEGMEDGWHLFFTGNLSEGEIKFRTKQEAYDFIKNNEGANHLWEEDRKYEIIYEKPLPYINTLEGKHYISEGDYIIIGIKGERYPCKPNIFLETYEKVE